LFFVLSLSLAWVKTHEYYSVGSELKKYTMELEEKNSKEKLELSPIEEKSEDQLSIDSEESE
jgi:hypothetical protein